MRQECAADAAAKAAAPIILLDAYAIAEETHIYSTALPAAQTDGSILWRDVCSRASSLTSFVAQLSNEELARLCVGYYSETSGGGVVGDASTQVAGGAGETSHALVQRGVPSLVMADTALRGCGWSVCIR